MCSAAPQVELKGIEKRYGELSVLNGVDLAVYPGDFLLLLGKSGAGKSTLLNIIGLMENYNSGEYCCFGIKDPIKSERESRLLRRNKLAYLFQTFALIDSMSVADNINMAFKYSDSKDKKAELERVLAMVGLESKKDAKIFELSEGEKQRTALARNMVKPFELLLADEPTASLDGENRKRVMNLLKSINQQGRTVIVVSHDESFRMLADRTYVINDGVLIK